MYQTKDAPRSAREGKTEALALYSGAAFPYFMNLSHGWAAHGLGERLVRIPVPVWSAWCVLALFVASLAAALWNGVAAVRAGRPFPTLRLLHVAMVVANFWVALLWAGREDLLIAVLFITSYHDVQYHGVVWLLGRRRSAEASAPMRGWVRALYATKWRFAAAMTGGALAQAFLRNDFQAASSVLPESFTAWAGPAMFSLFASFTYMHYFVDGKMWRMRDDPRLGVELGLARRK